LLTIFQCRFFRLKATLVTWRSHSPVLQTESVRSAQQHAYTPPKHSDPVTVSLPAGAVPETVIV
jgi:hypothetical protein